jgi:hypothetical protein
MTERSGMSRRQALMYGGLAAAVPLLPAMRPAAQAGHVSWQPGWRWCRKCQGLWFAGNGAGGACPAGGFHVVNGSYGYQLSYGSAGPVSSGRDQPGWRWCCRCRGLWFAEKGAGGACPAGGFHVVNGSYQYQLSYGNSAMVSSGSDQPGWRWCYRCRGLWLAANGAGGACPAGGSHVVNGSYNYFLSSPR